MALRRRLFLRRRGGQRLVPGSLRPEGPLLWKMGLLSRTTAQSPSGPQALPESIRLPSF